MAKTATIKLGDVDYVVHSLNLDELEEIGQLLDQSVSKATSVKILKIALRRAEPKIEDVGKLEMSFKELNAATQSVLTLSGLETTANPPVAAADQAAAVAEG